MTVDFNDYFWGEKNNGFDVLYHNMKFGLVASKELSEFFREKSNIEEQNSKLMSKLAHKASTGTLNSTFAPIWTILRTSAEKLSTLHMQMVQKLSELVKDVGKYADELHKKHKTVKEEESQTLDCVKAIQASTTEVHKARDLYSCKVIELEKLRKDNASQKDIEKLEVKLRKLQDDYKTLLDKHNPIKHEFEKRMTQTCKHFQEIEEIHLRQMKEFLSTYLELLQNNHDMVGQVHSDFKRQFLDMTVDKLLEQFVLNKYTGLEKPEMLELEFIPLSINQQLSATSGTRLNQPNTASLSSVQTNSNSATSINRAGNVSMDQRGGGAEAISLCSAASTGGSGSLANPDDTILTTAKGTAGIVISRPNSPEVTNAAVTVTRSTTTGTATTVKSNLLNWFSSNIPSKQQTQQQQQQQQQCNATTTNSAVTASGNFGMDDGCVVTSTVNHHHHHPHHHHFSSPQNSAATANAIGSAGGGNGSGSITQRRTTSLLNIFSSNSQVSGILRSRRDKAKTKKLKKKKDGEITGDNIQEERTQSVDRIHGSIEFENLHQMKMKSQNSNDTTNGPLATALGLTSTAAGSSAAVTAVPNINNQDYAITTTTTINTVANSTAINTIPSPPLSSHQVTSDLCDILGGGGGGGGLGSSGSGVVGTNGAISNNNNNGVIPGSGFNPTHSDAVNNKITSLSTVPPAGNVPNAATIPTATSATTTITTTTYGSNEVDEDGYSLQPPKEIAWEENHENVGSFYSDSDSESDNDKPERRIHVKIKPLNNGQAPMSASVDELRATVENISLSPTAVFSHHSQQLQQPSRLTSRQQSPEISNASTPTATVHPYAPLQSPTLSMSNNARDRYADLGDIFSELGEVNSFVTPVVTSVKTRQIPTPTSGTIAIPRPPSRRSEMVASSGGGGGGGVSGRGRVSPAPLSIINRADSIGSLEFRTAIGTGIGTSRGPSPLTIGISDTIPLAVAFHEIIHAYFRGSDESRCQVKISGDMMLSFPAGIAGLLANNPNPNKLGFRIKNVQNLENFIPNSKLVQIDKSQSSSFSTMLEFNMPALTALLRRQAEHSPNASYFNVDILKYQVRTKPGASSCPFQLVCYWKCETTFTALKIDYKYNNHAMANACPLLNVTLTAPVNGSVRNVQSKPHSAWLGESNRLMWNFTDISQNSPDDGVGTLRARLELSDGPSTPALLTTQFNCEGTTLSGIEFELQGGGYRLSLVKRRFVSGKYVCEGDGIRSAATPTPPSVGSSSPFSAKSN